MLLSLAACAQSQQQPASSVQSTEEKTEKPAEQETKAEDTKADEAPAEEPANDTKETTAATVKFIHIWPEHEATMKKSTDMIEKANPGMKVETTIVPWNEITKTVQIALQSGDMYDVFMSWGGQIAGYNQIGALYDLTPALDADKSWKDSFVNESALSTYSANGKILGLPFRGTGVFVVYNKTLFDEKGYTVPTTQEELVTLMDKMIADNIVPFSLPGKPNGFQVSAMRDRLTNYFALEAGVINDPDRLIDRKLEWNGILAKGAQQTKDWYEKGYFGKNPFSIEREEAQSVFFKGGSGMLFCNNNELLDLRKLCDEFKIDIGSFVLPKPEKATELLFGDASYGDGFAVYSQTKAPDAAVAFMKGLTSLEVQTLWANEAYSAMCVKGISYSDPLLQQFCDEFAQTGKYRVVADYNAGNKNDLIGQAFVDYMQGKGTAEDYESKWAEITRKAIEDATE